MSKEEIEFPVNDRDQPSSGMLSGMTEIDETRTLEREKILTGIVESLDEGDDKFSYGRLKEVIEDLTDNNSNITKRGAKKVARHLINNGDVGTSADFNEFRLSTRVKNDDRF